MKLKGVKEIYAIFVSLFMDKMEKEEPIQIDIEKVIKKKAPEVGKKIPGFVYRFLEKTICQERMNYILREYADCKGVDFADALLSELNVKVKLETRRFYTEGNCGTYDFLLPPQLY